MTKNYEVWKTTQNGERLVSREFFLKDAIDKAECICHPSIDVLVIYDPTDKIIWKNGELTND